MSRGKAELLKLRSEVGGLRNRTNDLEKLLASGSGGAEATTGASSAESAGHFPRESPLGVQGLCDPGSRI